MSKQETAHKANRLAQETSPYLLQHAYNPVDWYAWGPEALEKARKEDKPILLSIGYAACHWCHVMERESFEDPSTATVMNDNFVNIKVDREERPDLDEIYMKAVQIMTGHGGWPMTVFLTPELKPFFGGTYFPPDDRHGMPAFKRVLAGVQQAWKEQQEQVRSSSNELTNYLMAFDQPVETSESAEVNRSTIDDSIDKILQHFDRHYGGLGSMPKFPHPSVLTLALRYVASKGGDASRKESCKEYITTTLDQMAYGGIHDQIGGGFSRYSVDRRWLIPHFEKMLYDNAMLAGNYFDGYALIHKPYWLQVGRDSLDFVLRELRTEGGAFYSSLDADSEGEEGKFYVWTPEEVNEILGTEDGNFFSEVYGIVRGGNFEHGKSAANLTSSPEALSKRFDLSLEKFWQKIEPLKVKMLAAREKRVRPGRDEKVLTSWNGLMISAFCKGYKQTRDKKYLEAAQQAANFILTNMFKDGRLLRTWGQGKAKLNAYLDDYAHLGQALLDLAEVDPDARWFTRGRELVDLTLKHFWDQDHHGFFYTSDDHESLLTRPKNYFDGSTPSGSSVMVMNLLRLHALTGEKNYHDKARLVLEIYSPHISKMPDQFANLLCALDFFTTPTIETAIVAGKNEKWEDMLFTVASAYLPNSVMLVRVDAEEKIDSPLFKDRGLLDKKTTVYICRNFTCEEPINDPKALKAKVEAL